MIRLRRSSYLNVLVMLCMMLSLVVVNQVSVILIDRVEHTLHHDHAPNPLAGTLQMCGGSVHDHSHQDGVGHHHHDAAPCSNDDHGTGDALAHQHIDASLVYILSATPVVSMVRQSTFVPVAVPEGLDRLYRYRLDRPPKA